MIWLDNGSTSSVPATGFLFYNKKYPFYAFGVASIIIAFAIVSALVCVRSMKRKRNGVSTESEFYIFHKSFTNYYIFYLLAYALLLVLGIVWYTIVKEYFLLFSCIFLPLIYETINIIYYNLEMNDFNFIANVTDYNKKIEIIKQGKLKLKQQQQTF